MKKNPKNTSIKKGIGFGLTSGVVTTVGVIIGLFASTQDKFVILAGIISVAIADAFSDALGIHISEESDINTTKTEIWYATIATFLGKLIVALTFVVPYLIFDLVNASIVSIVWGLILIIVHSLFLAKQRNENKLKLTCKHLGLVILVIIITFIIGKLIYNFNL